MKTIIWMMETSMLPRIFLALSMLIFAEQAYCLSLKDVLRSVVEPVATAPSGATQESPTQPNKDDDAEIGTWTDPKTGLTWARCPLGFNWQESGWCSGQELNETWWNAALAVEKLDFAGYSDWRIPTLRELNQIHNTCTRGEYINTESPERSYIEIATKDGTVKIQKSCGGASSPALDYAASLDERAYDSSWSSTLGGVFNRRSQYWVFKLHIVSGSYVEDEVRDMYALPTLDRGLIYRFRAFVWPVRGGSYSEFQEMLSAAKEEISKNIDFYKEQREVDVIIAEKKAKLSKEASAQKALADQATKQRHEAFRASLKAGDGIVTYAGDTFRGGIVLEVKGGIVKVQLETAGSSTVERWVNRSALYPRKDFLFY